MDEENTRDRIDDRNEDLKETAENLYAAASSKAPQFQNTGENARKWQSEVESFVRGNPTKAVFMALGAGFVLSRTFCK